MATKKRPHVALFFLGGSVIDERGRRGDQVTSAKEIAAWMASMSEMEIIADLEGFFISAGDQPPTLANWSALAQQIQKVYGNFDGFVVVHEIQSLPAAAAALNVMCQQLGKPIVVVGSPLRSRKQPGAHTGEEFGAKASFVNAVQVATSDLAEVAVVYGSNIFRGATLGFSDLRGMTGTPLGKIDFGMRLFGEQIRRAKRTPRFAPGFDPAVGVIDLLPGFDLRQLSKTWQQHHGLFLSASEPGGLPGLVQQVTQIVGTKLPVAIYTATQKGPWPAASIILDDPTRSAALVRFMWALGQTNQPAKLKKLLAAG